LTKILGKYIKNSKLLKLSSITLIGLMHKNLKKNRFSDEINN